MYLRNFRTRNNPFVKGENKSHEKMYEEISAAPLKIERQV